MMIENEINIIKAFEEQIPFVNYNNLSKITTYDTKDICLKDEKTGIQYWYWYIEKKWVQKNPLISMEDNFEITFKLFFRDLDVTQEYIEDEDINIYSNEKFLKKMQIYKHNKNNRKFIYYQIMREWHEI